ncbi:LysR family transcriptional regulator [Streptomyces sp. NBC_01142]|uniref:LysR family transcriptional regulator n=1 Tax=Streptomyces sp. NBC_01142 TaxID=2975865 RepID=UPI00225A4FDE|nr:LysR family transcriptional regulator [Streptomyces sp. NBC_01142]MCX4820894.1 LysR family transcriptional regulator [Streptomyces sp. NBC_01142]
MERRDIEIFLTLAEELHFGRSAERLHVSVAMVSKAVKKLERAVGAPLFDRTSRRVTLTPIGQRLDDDIRPAHQQILEGFARAVAAGSGLDGELRVGFLGTAVAQFVLQVAEAFQATHPACRVELIESRYADGTALLHGDTVDVLLIAAPGFDPDLVESPVLFREPPVLAVSARHPFARRASVCLEDLARDKVLRPRGIPAEIDALSVPSHTPAGRPIERGTDFATVQEMFALVGAGRGIFPVPTHAARYDARPDVVYVPLSDGLPYAWRLIWRAAAETSRTRAFCLAARVFVEAHGNPLLAA